MQTINSVIELKEAISRLEKNQSEQNRILKQQFCATVKLIRRASVIKNALIELITSPGFLSALASTVIGISTRRSPQPGNERTSGKMLMSLLGVIVQFGITRILSGKRRPRNG